MENKNSVSLIVGAILILVLGYGVLNIAKIADKMDLKQFLGAVSGPQIMGPSFSVNGTEETYFSAGFNSASTTDCSFGINATSTLENLSVQVNTATNTSLIWEIGKATVPDATTTKIGSTITTGSNEKITIVASTSPGTAGNNLVFSPGDKANVKHGGGFGKTDAHLIKGVCKAKFIVN